MKRLTAIALLLLANTTQAVFQLELKGYDIFGETQPGNGKFGSNGAALTGSLYGTFDITPHLQFYLIDDIDKCFRLSYTKPDVTPVIKMSPFYEKEIPSSNNIEAGIRYTRLGTLAMRLKNMWYLDALTTYPDYLTTAYTPADSATYVHSSDAVTRYTRNIAGISWLLPVSRFSMTADVNYFGLNYKRDQMGVNIVNFPPIDTVFSSASRTHSDLWSRFALGYAIIDGFNLGATTQIKNDLTGRPEYSLYRYSVQFDGAREFPLENRFAWNIAGRWFENPVMRENGFATGPGGTLYLRDVVTVTNGLFLKGLVCLEVGHNLYKQRFECAVRKAWDNESSLESGYFTNQGGLFPTQGFYARSKVYIVNPFSVALNIKSVWEGPDSENNNKLTSEGVTSYLKTAGNLELALAVVKDCELLSGLDYTHFNSAALKNPDFPSRGGVYLGVRMLVR